VARGGRSGGHDPKGGERRTHVVGRKGGCFGVRRMGGKEKVRQDNQGKEAHTGYQKKGETKDCERFGGKGKTSICNLCGMKEGKIKIGKKV